LKIKETTDGQPSQYRVPLQYSVMSLCLEQRNSAIFFVLTAISGLYKYVFVCNCV